MPAAPAPITATSAASAAGASLSRSMCIVGHDRFCQRQTRQEKENVSDSQPPPADPLSPRRNPRGSVTKKRREHAPAVPSRSKALVGRLPVKARDQPDRIAIFVIGIEAAEIFHAELE